MNNLYGPEKKKETKLSVSGYQLEKLAINVFENSGFDTTVEPEGLRLYTDFVAIKEKIKYFVEVKASLELYYRRLSHLTDYLEKATKMALDNSASLVLFVFSVINDEDIISVTAKYNNLIVFDLKNILYSTQGTQIFGEIISLLPFSVGHIEYKENDSLELGWLEHTNEAESIKRKID